MARIDELRNLCSQLQETIDAIDRMIEAEVAKSKSGDGARALAGPHGAWVSAFESVVPCDAHTSQQLELMTQDHSTTAAISPGRMNGFLESEFRHCQVFGLRC